MADTEVLRWRDVPCSDEWLGWGFSATLDVGMGWLRLSKASDPDPAGLVVVRTGDEPVVLFTARLLPPGLPRRTLLVRRDRSALLANVSRFGKALPRVFAERRVPFVEERRWFSFGWERAGV